MMLLNRLNSMRTDLWLEMKPYIFHLAVLLVLFYIVHQVISYVVQRQAVKKGTLDALKVYEARKKSS